jgi:hypothetical protein
MGAGGGVGGAKSAVSMAKLESLAALQMPFELKAMEVCLDSVRGRWMLVVAGAALRVKRGRAAFEPGGCQGVAVVGGDSWGWKSVYFGVCAVSRGG